jgi:hypothetical protein
MALSSIHQAEKKRNLDKGFATMPVHLKYGDVGAT